MTKKISTILAMILLIIAIFVIHHKISRRSLLQPRGMVLGLYAGVPNYDYHKELEQIANAGATCVSIQAIYLMDTGNSCEIQRHPTSSPTEASLQQTLREAKRHQLRTLLFPTINIRGEASNARWWRGNIEPSNWNLWWQNYIKFNVHLASIAQKEGVEWYSIGTEMTSTHRFPDHWRELAKRVREVFKGKIIYSINFDSHDNFVFGDCLDVIGINTYDPIVKHTSHPSSEQVRNGWWWIINKARTLQVRFNRPVMITEIGYPSIVRAHIGPWDFRTNKSKDLNIQNFLLDEAFKVLRDWNDGEAVFYYLYGENLNQKPIGGPEDRTYSVWGKPAEATVKNYFALPIFKKEDPRLVEYQHKAIIQSLASHFRIIKRYPCNSIPHWVKSWMLSHPQDKTEVESLLLSESKLN
jgi:hypothetical protein